jgi:hypothetical protein
MRSSRPLATPPTTANATSAVPPSTIAPTSAPYSAMAYTLLGWFLVMAACYGVAMCVSHVQRARALNRDLFLASLRPSAVSELPAPPNPYVAEPPTYAEIA